MITGYIQNTKAITGHISKGKTITGTIAKPSLQEKSDHVFVTVDLLQLYANQTNIVNANAAMPLTATNTQISSGNANINLTATTVTVNQMIAVVTDE